MIHGGVKRMPQLELEPNDCCDGWGVKNDCSDNGLTANLPR